MDLSQARRRQEAPEPELHVSGVAVEAAVPALCHSRGGRSPVGAVVQCQCSCVHQHREQPSVSCVGRESCATTVRIVCVCACVYGRQLRKVTMCGRLRSSKKPPTRRVLVDRRRGCPVIARTCSNNSLCCGQKRNNLSRNFLS